MLSDGVYGNIGKTKVYLNLVLSYENGGFAYFS